jgi:diguanylate cyclase (GGDEF)-like protein/PAS domain S-box-containing protein
VSNSAVSQEKDIEVLVLGCTDEDIRTFRRVLEPIAYPLSYRRICGLTELREALSAGSRQIVIAKDKLEGYDVLAAIEACKAVAEDIPCIVVSDDSSVNATEESAIELMQAGVRDYVFRDRLYRLLWAVQREIIRLYERRKFLEADKHTRRMEKRLAGLLDMAPDAVIATDSGHHITVFNKSAEKIFGYAAAEIIGHPLEDLMPARFAGGHHKHLSAFAQEPVAAREMGSRRGLVGLRKDGSEFPAEASISILNEETGPLFFAVLRDVTEKKRAAQELEYRATHDNLTGLPNRTLFLDRLSHALTLAEREEKLAALLFIDLDGFKRVNDTFGHAAGDELLRAVAQRLLESVRHSDTVARLGGDEFAVILEQIEHVDSVSAIAQKIVAWVQQPFRLAHGEVAVSASVGITICPFDAKSVKELMVDADRAMYVAKASGKNRFEFYSAGFAVTDAQGLYST